MTGRSDDTGDRVVHIGENAEIVDRSDGEEAAILELDEPLDVDAEPVSSLGLSAAIRLMDNRGWRPTVVTGVVQAHDGGEERTLALVHEDDPTRLLFVCPFRRVEEDEQETTA